MRTQAIAKLNSLTPTINTHIFMIVNYNDLNYLIKGYRINGSINKIDSLGTQRPLWPGKQVGWLQFFTSLAALQMQSHSLIPRSSECCPTTTTPISNRSHRSSSIKLLLLILCPSPTPTPAGTLWGHTCKLTPDHHFSLFSKSSAMPISEAEQIL